MELRSNFVVMGLPLSSDPKARLAYLKGLIFEGDRGTFLRLTGSLAVPFHRAYLNEVGQVVNKETVGFYRLENHMRWLEGQVERLDNPPQRLTLPKQNVDPQGRLDALMARIENGMFEMPNGTKVPVDKVSITDDGFLATEFTTGGFWRLVPHISLLEKLVAKKSTPRPALSQPQEISLPSVARPHERLAALKAMIVENGRRLFRMPDGELVPVDDVLIGDDGWVDTHRFAGSRTLLGHMTWLEEKPVIVSLGIPGVEMPVERYKALMTLTPDDENFDMNGTLVPMSEIWIHNDGRVSRGRFIGAFRVSDHIRWLEGKREVAAFIERRDAEARVLLAQAASNAPRVSPVKKMDTSGGRTRPARIQNLGDDRNRNGW